MQQIQKSGNYYANKFTRIALLSYEEMIGKNGLNAILNLAGLKNLIGNYPPDDLERQFDFADFAAIHIGLEEMVGARGGRGFAIRAGRAIFNEALRNFGALAGVADQSFKDLPLQARCRIGLPVTARIFSELTDQQSTVNETDTTFLWTIHRCPICWSRKGVEKPVCSLFTGVLEALLAWVSDGLEFQVSESRCCAMGDTVCEFIIQKEPIASANGKPGDKQEVPPR
jgi:predicted hydrocarbon binding protein